MSGTDSWIQNLTLVIDSLELVDLNALPPSFAQNLLPHARAAKAKLDSLAENERARHWIEQVAGIAAEAGHRNWFFWERCSRAFAQYAAAETCAIFRAGGGTALTKIHPLQSEEDLEEISWPEGVDTPIYVEDLPERQRLLIRLGEHQPLVFILERESLFPRIDRAALEVLLPWSCALGLCFAPFLTNQLPRPMELVQTEPSERDPKSERPILGQDPIFLRSLNLVEQAAKSDASVYLHGESGTGKEVFARHLHQLSDRASGPFVPINCSAIPHELIESEMFGHEKGAFTGAYYRKIGRAEQAHGGTLFLDEIGEMPLAFQAKLLRFLQEKTFTRVGGNQQTHSDARIVVATHRDLKLMVAEKSFREDLYYRIHVIPIQIPPLRARGRDIRLIALELFAKYIGKSRASRRQVDESVFEALERYPFPGNVRELDNIVQRTVVMTQKPVISAEDLPPEVFEGARTNLAPAFHFHPFEDFDHLVPIDRDTLRLLKRDIEQIAMSYQRDIDRRFLLHLLEQSGGSARKAAEVANINRTLFYKLLKKAGIDIAQFSKGDT